MKKQSTRTELIDVRDATIQYANFSGRVTEFNRDGYRSFELIIQDQDFADYLENLGFNVRLKKDKDYDEPVWKLKIRIGNFFNNGTEERPVWYPMIKRYYKGESKILYDKTLGQLDYMQIERVNIRFHGQASKGSGQILAWLDAMFIEVADSQYSMRNDFSNLEFEEYKSDALDINSDALPF